MSAEIVEATDATWETMIEKGEMPAVVMFYSPECPHCRTMEPYFQTLAERYGKVIVFARLNSAANLWTAERYGIRGTPTFKFFCKGRPVAELVGAVYPAMLEKRIEDLLEHGEECIRSSTAIDYEITGYG
ncbi:thioredoxin family protein [Methanoculleus sp. FWC-SCC1]|uniref:Thioredoxin family protein n=1 Tax=Methanoculleus frigidifontis TaxID=2584085 RepID=A0ABT8M7G7_9EURY|nr:thioredoxin family protein [Methanoculleus sp. FWC-SCC1]MDN7023879.1 thioredoxin family protein [Methanoculleus sp. FWC-SCC1]